MRPTAELMHHKGRLLVVSAVTAAVAVTGTGAAFAASTGTAPAPARARHASAPTTLAGAQKQADKSLTRAQTRLVRLQKRIDRAGTLAVDRTLLDGEISSLSARVAAVRLNVDAATTVAGVAAALAPQRALSAQGRVLVRQVGQLRTADAASAAVGPLAALGVRVAALPAGSPAHSAFADLQAKVADAATLAGAIESADRAIIVTDVAGAAATLAGNKGPLAALRADRTQGRADRKVIAAALTAPAATATPAGASPSAAG